MDMPKTKECCGRKPLRIFHQTGYRDDEGNYILQCRKKCGNRVVVQNKWTDTETVEREAVKLWNEIKKEN